MTGFVTTLTMIGAAAGIAAAWFIRPASFRYRMTVTVRTPDGECSGSAVHEIYGRRLLFTLPDAQNAIMELSGEAVVIEAPGGEKLFALMHTPGGGDRDLLLNVKATLVPTASRGMTDTLEVIRTLSGAAPGTVSGTMRQEDHPLLVRFKDITDPKSVEEVTKADPVYRVEHVRLTVVDASVSRGIKKILPWLPDYRNQHLNGERTHRVQSPDLAAHLGAGSFSILRRRSAAVVLAAAAAIGAYAFWSAPTTYRYRITAEVETPQGLRTGSAVHELRLRRQARLSPEAGKMSLDLAGEAVAIDLPGGRTLYALLRHPTGNYPWEVLRFSFGWGDGGPARFKKRLDALQATGSHADLAPKGYPVLAHFEDPLQPSTVRVVAPSDLAGTFGPGVRLRRIRIAMTADPVSQGIRERLPWLERYPEPRLKTPIDPHDTTLVAHLVHGDLVQGIRE